MTQTQTHIIWKYPLEDVIEMPTGARILSAQAQHDTIMIWAMVDPVAPLERRRFLPLATGQPIPGDMALTHLGTVQLPKSALVFHVFEHTPDMIELTFDAETVRQLERARVKHGCIDMPLDRFLEHLIAHALAQPETAE